ncbi:sulfotransferase [Frigidibacter sp. RF13]|uniref:tetratricopeptide repeat-containing sulfotransferase family protein n=1 Tax=Frigidibacter sp. RF13 TaxID=2997340 RepID=UPI0022711D46|nr:tetratricopeptide repeat-containing sulfotransferase family protein [Frigidibacter sp. RF13]MCY1128379.1 sulfotransferase [Frigidibacter sp. RF13]
MPPLTNDQIKSFYAAALKDIMAKRFDEALKRLEAIVETNPNLAEAHYQVGRVAIESNRAKLALKPLRSAARLKPAESAIWISWAEALALGGNAEDETEFLAAIKGASLRPELRIELQDRFAAKRAKSQRSGVGQKARDTARLLDLMGKGDFEKAEALASALLRQDPELAVAANVLGGTKAMRGRLAEAAPHFRHAIKIDPGYAEAHDNLGRILMQLHQPAEAVPHLRQAVIVAPYMVSAIINLAACLALLGQAQAGIPPLERAVAANPKSPTCWLALGNAHTRARNYAKAETALEKAVELSDGKMAEALGMLAQAQARLGKDESALENYERALAADPNSPIATGGKAMALQTLGRFEEARPLFLRAFEIDPTNGENYRSYIAAHKTKAGDPVIDRMINIYNQKGLSDFDRMNLGFAIAKALEDTKDDGRVFGYLDAANALMRKIFAYDPHSQIREREALRAAYAGSDWSGRIVADTTDYAPIFVTGMPRSGTTLVEQIISSHSRVRGAGEVGKITGLAQKLLTKGTGLRAISSVSDSEIAGLGREYAAFMRERFGDELLASDKSIQTYLYLGLVKLAIPNARIVVVRRDPRDNLLSMYKNKFPDGAHLYAYDQHDLVVLYETFVQIVDYWREVMPGEFYEVDYDKLVADPEPETRKLIAACGLEWEDACLRPEDNDRKVETLSLYQVRQPISKSSVKGWKRFEKDLKPMLDELKARGLVSD